MVQFLSESAELAACVSLSPVCVFMGTDTLAIPSYPGWSVKAPFGSFPAGVESSLLVALCQICSVSSFCPQAPSRGGGGVLLVLFIGSPVRKFLRTLSMGLLLTVLIRSSTFVWPSPENPSHFPSPGLQFICIGIYNYLCSNWCEISKYLWFVQENLKVWTHCDTGEAMSNFHTSLPLVGNDEKYHTSRTGIQLWTYLFCWLQPGCLEMTTNAGLDAGNGNTYLLLVWVQAGRYKPWRCLKKMGK